VANRAPDPALVEHLRMVLDDAHAPNEDDDPDGEEPKNVYAQFGAPSAIARTARGGLR
jgi:hypothetical protein